jgi:2'-5' RNA ligase
LTAVRRAFVAVVPHPASLDALEALVGSLRADAGAGLRWNTRDQWHCTLQFLGAVADVDAVVGSLEAGMRGVAPFTVQLGGAGAFPSAARAAVLWVGVTTGDGELAGLAEAVEDATTPLGFAGERRRFRPHVTVARAPAARDVRDVVTTLGSGTIGPAWTVSEVVLFESDTRPSGAVYREIGQIPLGEVAPP